jgi:hypothetical protein
MVMLLMMPMTLGRRPAAEHVFLKVGRYIDDEGEPPRIHERDDVALGDRLRRLKIGRQKRPDDAARQLGMILIHIGHGSIMQLLRIALRLGDDDN